MLKIEFDPSTLTRSQREDLASFILGWGTAEEYENLATVTTSDGETLQHPKSAPSSADADRSSIALVDTTVNTSAGIAPLPPVPMPGTPVGIAVPQSPNLAEVDSKGMPWDARIHSSSKAKVADGSWKYRRGVSDEEVKRVENELRNPTAEVLFTGAYIQAVVGADEVKAGEELFTAPVPVSGIAPPPPLGALPAMSGASGTFEPDLRKEFAQLMIRVAQAKGAGKITTEEVTSALAAHGVPSLPMLSTKLDRVSAVAAEIDALIASRG